MCLSDKRISFQLRVFFACFCRYIQIQSQIPFRCSYTLFVLSKVLEYTAILYTQHQFNALYVYFSVEGPGKIL